MNFYRIAEIKTGYRILGKWFNLMKKALLKKFPKEYRFVPAKSPFPENLMCPNRRILLSNNSSNNSNRI